MSDRRILSGKNLFICRRKCRMPAETLAKKLGPRVTVEMIEAWESGKKNIPLTYYGALFDLFGYGLVDEVEILPVRLKNIFLESFRQYGILHNSEPGYGEFDGDEMFLEAILEISNIALKKATDIKQKIVLSKKESNQDVIVGKAYSHKGIAIGNYFRGKGGIVRFNDILDDKF